MTKYPAHFSPTTVARLEIEDFVRDQDQGGTANYERLYALLDALEKAAREVTDAEWAEACQRADYPIAGRDESRALLDALNMRLKG